jgi:hypothetical protein
MRLATIATVLAIALPAAADAQDTTVKSRTNIKADDARVMSMTGCLRPELGTGLYTLEGAVAASGKEIQTNSKVKTDFDMDKTTVRGKTETKANNGAVATAGSSTFLLVPANNVDLASHVGEQVQISAIMVNAGHGDADIKIKNETKVDPENGRDTKTNSKTKLELPRSSAGQYTVMSVTPTGRPCTR